MQLNSTPDLVLVSDDASELEDFNLGVEITKSLAKSAVQTGGVLVMFGVIAVAFEGGLRLKKRFENKKKPNLYVITDLPETAEN